MKISISIFYLLANIVSLRTTAKEKASGFLQKTCEYRKYFFFLNHYELYFVFRKKVSNIKLIYVLVSAGTELILFLVAGAVLCFGFSVRIVLITL